MKEITFSLVIILTSFFLPSSLLLRIHNSVPQQTIDGKYFQDFTILIDKIVYDGNSMLEEDLSHQMKGSSHVFYSTNEPLNNLPDVALKVITLLSQINPDHRLILSMKYINGSKFRWSRMQDLYYDLQPNISESQSNLATKHLSAVLLDWRLPDCYKDILGRSTNVDLKKDYSFPKYVKNFLELTFGSVSIPVGLQYSADREACNAFLDRQFLTADFLVPSLTFEYKHRNILSLYPENFRLRSEHALSQIFRDQTHLYTKYVPSKIPRVHSHHYTKYPVEVDFLGQQRSKPMGENKPVTVFLDIRKSGGVSLPNITWTKSWQPLVSSIESLPNFTTISHNFLHRLHNGTYLKFFAKLALKWAQSNGVGIIVGGMADQVPTLSEFLQDSRRNENINLIQFVAVSEETNDLALLESTLSGYKSKHRNIIFSLDAWRAVARFEKELDNIRKSRSDHGNAGKNRTGAMIRLDDYTCRIWNEIELPVKRLLESKQNMSEMTLETLIFPAGAFEQQNSSVINFVSSPFITKTQYKLGCYLTLDHDIAKFGHKLAVGNNENRNLTNTPELKKIMKGLMCEPIFDNVTVLIWGVDGSRDDYFRFPEVYQDIFFLREVFMQAYPDKEVIVDTGNSNELRKALTKIFQAPVLLQ